MAEGLEGPSSIPYAPVPSQIAIGEDARYPDTVVLKVSDPTGHKVIFVPIEYAYRVAQQLGAYCHAKLTRSDAPKLIVPAHVVNGKKATNARG